VEWWKNAAIRGGGPLSPVALLGEVKLDVVYNHLGPEGIKFWRICPYFNRGITNGLGDRPLNFLTDPDPRQATNGNAGNGRIYTTRVRRARFLSKNAAIYYFLLKTYKKLL